MKNITVSVDDELYHEARVEAARQRKSLSALVREFLTGLRKTDAGMSGEDRRELEKLWAIADAKPKRAGSVGPLNREELYQRGISRH